MKNVILVSGKSNEVRRKAETHNKRGKANSAENASSLVWNVINVLQIRFFLVQATLA